MWKSFLFLFSLMPMSLWATPFPSLTQYAFQSEESGFRKGPRTHALIVVRDGKRIFEQYDRGYLGKTKHTLWSVSKSVTSLLFAVAEHKGLARREDSICKHDDSVPKDKCAIRYQDLLQFTSGLYWVEEYEKSGRPRRASVLAMLYGEGRRDMREFVLSQPLVAAPGTLWRYSSGDTLLLMAQLPRVFKKDIHQIVDTELFGPLGITDWTLEADESGHGVGASYFHLTSEDLLKIGQLLLARGKWQGQSLFDPRWIDFVSTVPPAFKRNRPDHDESKDVGGGSFWLNIKGLVTPEGPWPQFPEDTYAALGHWGQYLVVVPSMKMVVVRFGDTRDKEYFVIRGMLNHLAKDLKL